MKIAFDTNLSALCLIHRLLSRARHREESKLEPVFVLLALNRDVFFFSRSTVYRPMISLPSHEDNEISAIITGNDTRFPVANQFALAFMVASPAARPVVRGIVVGIMVALPGRKHHDYPTRAHTRRHAR
jgi:hypothetical protein